VTHDHLELDEVKLGYVRISDVEDRSRDIGHAALTHGVVVRGGRVEDLALALSDRNQGFEVRNIGVRGHS
jgi:hypothetical protein